jgi:hypothetical protein
MPTAKEQWIMKKLLLVATAIAPLALALPATADDDDARCPEIAADQWMSIADVDSKLTAMGYRVREIERDDNCYEVEGTDANGAEFEAYVNPLSGDIVPPREKRS